MNPENVIEVDSASVRYRVTKSRRRSFREAVFRTLLRRIFRGFGRPKCPRQMREG